MEHLMDLFAPEEGKVDKPLVWKSSLPPEIEEGNVEYKLKLLNPTDSRFEHLVTQMNWRLKEGSGEAIYEIGVSDNGDLCGLSQDDLDSSLKTLNRMAERLGATVTVIHRNCVQGYPQERFVAEVLVRKVPENQQFIDIRIAVLGNVEAGKSTLLGVLTQGELDNGRGRARLNLFRHLHEIQSGRTSSISHEILGFNSKGEAINYSMCKVAEEICEISSKVVTLIDLAGHQKYLRTTVFGLTAHCPEFVMLLVAGNTGVVETTKLHYSYTSALKLRTFFVVTKADACYKEELEKTVEDLKSLILKNRGVPLVVNDEHVVKSAEFLAENNAVPILTVSSVTGYNLDLLKKLLNALPPLLSKKEKMKQEQDHPEFQVDEIYSVPNAGGVVVGGVLTKGVLCEGDSMQILPGLQEGQCRTKILSIHRYRVACRVVKTGQYATLALKGVDKSLVRKVHVCPSNAHCLVAHIYGGLDPPLAS
jgi:GTPase